MLRHITHGSQQLVWFLGFVKGHCWLPCLDGSISNQAEKEYSFTQRRMVGPLRTYLPMYVLTDDGLRSKPGSSHLLFVMKNVAIAWMA